MDHHQFQDFMVSVCVCVCVNIFFSQIWIRLDILDNFCSRRDFQNFQNFRLPRVGRVSRSQI